MKTGELYWMLKGTDAECLVIYLREDTKYAQQHWVIHQDGSQESVWTGHLKPVTAD